MEVILLFRFQNKQLIDNKMFKIINFVKKTIFTK